MRHWNDERIRCQYERIQKDAIEHDGFSAEEVASHYLDKLGHQTKSSRIMRMMRLAYTLGWLRGIAYVDEGKTPVTISRMDAPTGAGSDPIKDVNMKGISIHNCGDVKSQKIISIKTMDDNIDL